VQRLYVRALLRLKGLWYKKSYVVRSRIGLFNLTNNGPAGVKYYVNREIIG